MNYVWGGGGERERERINFRVMLRPQHFYNKSYEKNCYWWVKK